MADGIRLTREEWIEIFHALDTKRRALEDSAYEDPMRGPQSERLEKLEWALDLLRIMDKIGHNGECALHQGVVPIASPAITLVGPASRSTAARAANTPWRAAHKPGIA